MTPKSMKRMYAHALTGMARELELMKAWPELSQDVLTALDYATHFLTLAAVVLAGNFEAPDELDYVCSRLEDLVEYATLPGEGNEMISSDLEEVLHIRAELGYL